jgi:hypothetical protein
VEVPILLRSARLRRGVTQAELARRAQTSQPAIARLEKGRNSPSIDTLERLLRALGFRLQIEALPADTGVDRTLIAAALRLSPEERLRRTSAAVRSIYRMRRGMPHSKS